MTRISCSYLIRLFIPFRIYVHDATFEYCMSYYCQTNLRSLRVYIHLFQWLLDSLHLHAISSPFEIGLILHYGSLQGYFYVTSLHFSNFPRFSAISTSYSFRYLTTRIYSFSFFSYIALKALSAIKYFALCGSVVQLRCQPSLYSFFSLKLESCFVFRQRKFLPQTDLFQDQV